MIVLSILICSLYERAGMLASLLAEINRQAEENNAHDKIEILVEIDNRGETTTGEKRNRLVQKAIGVYQTQIDDDDWIAPDYLSEILSAAKQDCDAIAISGWIETNGRERIHWDISKDYPYETWEENGIKRYVRWNNHISPIKSEIAKQFKFQNKNFGEDWQWSLEIHNAGAIKTEAKTEGELYYYRYDSTKK